MAPKATLRRVLEQLRLVPIASPNPEPAAPDSSEATARRASLGDEALLIASMSAAELSAWENRDVPTVDRASDRVETVADEKQELATSLNFPLHWTSAALSWNYLFDFAVACELLAPRPDDLVLDLAAGTGWASELLCRLGVRTVSIDLSEEMLRRSRQRMASDSRLIFRDQCGFVVARGQSLPFAAESFDAVLCMNALHHLPSFGEALGEVHRVLKAGGRAVFSEPGATHAVQPLSRFRMREESILEKSVSLPLIHRLAIAAGFSRMRVVPLRSAGAYAFDYSASTGDEPPLRQMWDDTLELYPREHARFVLYKGDDRPADTLLPAPQLAGRLQAQIEILRGAPVAAAGASLTDRLRIRNTGTVAWRARGRRFGGQVTCGLKICDASGEVLREDLGRTPLAADVEPGGQIEIDVNVAGQLAPGRYELRYDMVVEGVTWFEIQGSPCATRSLEVK
jgi:SAM-dependent methyltransferase